ncbi:iron ABC transporter permease [Telmatospirillum sp. J64-1]|uniref:ABC transporter permease n=1 Tax=Telmatospirillum sp. J64-1 TaxID=2502183 RepID=UPI001C8F2599|nr:iron ABC transporter permease [Telmatospirillum sp. J64-1]
MTVAVLTASIRRSAAIRSFDGGQLLLAILAVYVALLCVLPLGRLLMEALVPGGQAFDWALIERVLSSRAVRTATLQTIEASLGATMVSLLLGTALALVIGVADVRFKSLVVFLALLPMLIPAQISALAWLELMGPSSPILSPLGLAPGAGTRNPLYSREGIILLMGIEHSTIVFLAVLAGLRSVPADLVEAARAAGARPLRIVFTVILPLLRPALIAGGALAFVSAIGNFGIPALLGIPGRYTMLTTLIYQRLNGFGPSILGEVAVLALVLAVLAAMGLLVQAWAMRGRKVVIMGGGIGSGSFFRLRRWRLPIEAGLWAVLLLISILPLVALGATSIVQALGVPLTLDSWTWRHYEAVLSSATIKRAFGNSFLLALGAALVSMAVAVPIAYYLHCRRSALARFLNSVADAPYALPGIVLSIAFILVLLRPLPVFGIGLYGTIWIILAAYLARFLALALRPSLAGMQQIDTALEEAARMAGARSLRRLATIVLPLAAPAAAAGAILIFMSAFSELTVSVLLWSSGHETIGVMVFNMYDEGNATGASAVAVLTVLATLLSAAVLSLLARRLPKGILPWQA